MPLAIGLDVSKQHVDAVILLDEDGHKKRHKRFSNTAKGHEQLLAWTQQHSSAELSDCQMVMEATGPYHENLALALYQAGAVVSVVNPKRLKDFASGLGLKAKNDPLDAFAMARYGQLCQPQPWQPDPPEYRHLKELLSRLEALQTDRQRERNRLEKAQATETSAAVLDSLERSLAFLETEYQRLRQEINEHINRHPKLKNDRQLLESIPGIGPVLSAQMLALLHGGQRFERAPQFASYLGLIPTQHQSGSSINKKPHLSKLGPPRVRAKLYMAAIVASGCNPDVKALYQRLLERGKCPMAALGAAMRKLAQICFGVIKHQTPFQPQIAV
jgi:transposase